MKSVEFAPGVIGQPTGIPTAWWTLHELDDGIRTPLADDDMFRLVSGQHIGQVFHYQMDPAGHKTFSLKDIGHLWLIMVIAGMLEMILKDEDGTSANRNLLTRMGVLAGGKISFTGEALAPTQMVFISARE